MLDALTNRKNYRSTLMVVSKVLLGSPDFPSSVFSRERWPFFFCKGGWIVSSGDSWSSCATRNRRGYICGLVKWRFSEGSVQLLIVVESCAWAVMDRT